MKILEVEQWGDIMWTDMNSAFANCELLDITATDSPNLSLVTDMSFMFGNCFVLTGTPEFNNWDTSNVNNMYYMFGENFLFNQPLGNWNVSQVTNFGWMFHGNNLFNQDLNSWDTSSSTHMDHMFHHCTNFNYPLNNWDTSDVITMDTMFAQCDHFNQPLDAWETSNVMDMDNMFSQAYDFNQPLNTWDISNVRFANSMFYEAESFDQPLNDWNVQNLIEGSFMFNGAINFNQNLGSWQLNRLALGQYFIANTAIDCENYNTTLMGWSANPNIVSGLDLGHLSPLVYSTEEAFQAREFLINQKYWDMQGDIYNPNCNLSVTEFESPLEINVFPNPAEDFFRIKSRTPVKKVMLFDNSAKILQRWIANTQNYYQIDPVPSGSYFLLIETEKDSHFVKILIR